MYIIIIYDHICIHTFIIIIINIPLHSQFIIIYIIHVLYHIRILCIVPCNKLMNCFTFHFYCVWVQIYVPLGVYLWVKIYVPLGIY